MGRNLAIDEHFDDLPATRRHPAQRPPPPRATGPLPRAGGSSLFDPEICFGIARLDGDGAGKYGISRRVTT